MNKDEIDLLDKTLTKANDWLKFAEAKNGAIIAIVCTVMFGVYRAFSTLDEIPNILFFYLSSFYFFSILSLVVSLTSFIPRLKQPFWLKVENKKVNDNPFFFGDACKYDSYSYLDLLKIDNLKDDRIAEKLADQIVANSKIAFIKYRQFTISAWLFLSALTTPLGALIVWALRN